jgi:hypothetical protein
MSDNVQLKINAINQLKLLRASTFKDKLCFLDEDVQNAQRAKASEIKVYAEYGNDSIVIENNGKVLDNPQSLFSIAESGWDDETKASENPFGTGFFSNITVSNYIEIFSGNKHIIFDVEQMINTQNTDIFVEEVDDVFQGFKLILHNFDFETASYWDIKERVELLGKYIHELDIYFNDNLMKKKDLTEGDDCVFQSTIEQEDLNGWLSLYSGWSSNNINIFYKGRLVTNLDFSYVRGDLHISDKTLNLTSPDRKDIIKDEKLSEFKQLIKLYIEDLCNNALLNGDETDVETYANAISYYADKEKVKHLVRFATFDSKQEDDIEYLKGIGTAKLKNPSINNLKEYVLFLNQECLKEKQQDKTTEEDVKIHIEIKNKPKEAKGIIKHEGYVDRGSDEYHEAYIEKPGIDENDLVEKKGELLVVSNEPTFWMTFNDITQYEYKFNTAKHYKLKIIIARNKVEEELLKSLKYSDNILHISELKEKVEINATLSNTDLSLEEQRATMLFNMISKEIFQQNHNLFVIGDVMVTKKISVESLKEENELIEDNITVVKNEESKEIFIDRSTLQKHHLEQNLNEELNLNDYKFILANLKNIAKEIDLLAIANESKAINLILEALSNAI